MSDVTVVMPTIPPRWREVQRAVASVMAQTYPVAALSIAQDVGRLGAGPTRQRALDGAQTEWVAFLDDDDTMDPTHVAVCMAFAQAMEADVVVPWYRVDGGTDPCPGNRDVEFSPFGPLHSFGITCLVRRSCLGGLRFAGRGEGEMPEDWRFWNELSASGARLVKLHEVTWTWFHHGANTSGLPQRW